MNLSFLAPEDWPRLEAVHTVRIAMARETWRSRDSAENRKAYYDAIDQACREQMLFVHGIGPPTWALVEDSHG